MYVHICAQNNEQSKGKLNYKKITVQICWFDRVASMIQQYTAGMDACGHFWQMVLANSEQFTPLFTNTGEKLSRITMKKLLKPVYSEEGSNQREAEETTVFQFEQWLVAIEGRCNSHFQLGKLHDNK